jgi:hypothetical protein
MKLRFPKSQRDFVTQPKVAESARLLWVGRRNDSQPRRGCVTWRAPYRHNPVGAEDDFDSITQGSSVRAGRANLATAGLTDVAPLKQIKWAKQRQIVADLDALQAEVDALKRLPAASAIDKD